MNNYRSLPRVTTIMILALIMPIVAQGAVEGINPSQIIPKRLLGLAILTFLLICLKIGWLALTLLYSVLRPQKVIKGSQSLAQNYSKSLFIGLLLLIFYLLLIKMCRLAPASYRYILLIPVFLALLSHILIGFSMISHALGERIQANINSHTLGSTFFAVLYGALIILLLDFVPLLGHIVTFIIILIGMGVAVTEVFRKTSDL